MCELPLHSPTVRPSDSQTSPCLPGCLPDSRNHPEQRQLAETDSAKTKAAQEGARAPTPTTAILDADLELRLPLALLDHGLTSHRSFSLLLPWLPYRPNGQTV